MADTQPVSEEAEKRYMPSLWSLGLKGDDRIKRFRQLCTVQSDEYTARHPIESVAYGPDESQGLNVFRVKNHKAVAVFVHGGYWIQGNRHLYNFVAGGLCGHGFSVVVVGYRLATQRSGLGICVEDVTNGLRKVLELFGCDTPIHILGHSAGAHLSLVALAALAAEKTSKGLSNHQKPFASVCCLCGIYSPAEIVHTSVGAFLNQSAAQLERYSASASEALRSAAALHFIVAEFDAPAFRDAGDRLLAAEIGSSLPTGDTTILSGEDHFSVVENLYYANAPLVKLLCRFWLDTADVSRVT